MKLDVSKIAGFETMSESEKLAALLAYEIDDPSPSDELAKLKAQLSKSNSEAADYKRRLREKQTEEEKAAEERAAKEKEKDERIESLQRSVTISEMKANYLSLGYPEDLATSSAEAVADNDMAKVLSNQKLFNEKREKELLAEALKKTPRPEPGEKYSSISKEDFKKLSYNERIELKEKHPEKYRELIK